MAVGYHKLNTSAARAKKIHASSSSSLADDVSKVARYPKNLRVVSSSFGSGVTTTSADSENDVVEIDFSGQLKKMKLSYVKVVNA